MNKTELKQTIEDSLQTISEAMNTVQMLPKEAKNLYDAMNNIHSGVIEYLNQDLPVQESKNLFITEFEYCNRDVKNKLKINELKGYSPDDFDKHFIATKIPLVEGDSDDTSIIMHAVDKTLEAVKSKLTITREVKSDDTCGENCGKGSRLYTVSFKKSDLKK